MKDEHVSKVHMLLANEHGCMIKYTVLYHLTLHMHLFINVKLLHNCCINVCT